MEWLTVEMEVEVEKTGDSRLVAEEWPEVGIFKTLDVLRSLFCWKG